jgi:hypothetical protein
MQTSLIACSFLPDRAEVECWTVCGNELPVEPKATIPDFEAMEKGGSSFLCSEGNISLFGLEFDDRATSPHLVLFFSTHSILSSGSIAERVQICLRILCMHALLILQQPQTWLSTRAVLVVTCG